MSKSIQLRTELQRLLETIITNVYHEDASDKRPYPYLVYELSDLTYEYGKTLMQLEINILDYGKPTNEVETIADTVQETLNGYYFINSEIQFVIYKGLKQTVKEEDKKIIRRRLLFEIQLHELKGE